MAERTGPDRGTALLLVPAGFVVLLVLAAITFDFAHLYLAKRELTAVAEAAANDAVTVGVDPAQLRAGGGVHLDPARVALAVEEALAAHGRDLTILDVRSEIVGDTRVEVAVTASISYVFARAVPGGPRNATVTVRVAADAVL